MQGKHHYLPLQTADSHMKVSFFMIWEVWEKGEGGGPDGVPDVVSLCLSDHSSAGIFPPLGFFPQTTQAGRRPQHLNAPHLIFIGGFLTNPYKNAPLSRAAAQINYYCTLTERKQTKISYMFSPAGLFKSLIDYETEYLEMNV